MILETIETPRRTQPQAQPSAQPDTSAFVNKLTDKDKFGSEMTDTHAAQLDDVARWMDDNVADDVKATLGEVMDNTSHIHPLRDIEGVSDTKGMYIMADEVERRSLNLRFNEIPEGEQQAWNRLWNDTYKAERQKRLAAGVPDRDLYKDMQPWAEAWKQANPQPAEFVVRSTEKIGGSTVHELGHGLDMIHGRISKTDAFTNMHKSVVSAFESGSHPELWYAASQPTEMFAELFKFYSLGDGTLSAEAWRAANPRWSSTMKGLLT